MSESKKLIYMVSTPPDSFLERFRAECLERYGMAISREAVAVVARVSSGEVLMLRRPDGDPHAGWSLPGGRIDLHLGESVQDAALRELREETGLAGTIVTVRPWTAEVERGRDGHRWDVHVVLVDVRRHEVALSVEHVEARWMTADAALSMEGLVPDATRSALSWYRSRATLLGELEGLSRLPAEDE